MNVVLNSLFIPFFGAAGAAIASVISQMFTNIFVGFIISAIRPNNALMLSSLNPKILTTAFSKFYSAVAGRFKGK